MARIRNNYVSGTLALQLDIDGTTLTATSLAYLDEVTGGDTAVLTLDPFGAHGRPETVIITDHAATATTATILRGQEDSAAALHPAGTLWVHAPINTDFTAAEARLDAIEATPGTAVATATPVALTVGGGNVLGTATTVSRADHKHAIAAGTPGTSVPGDSAAAGAATTFARSDHQHARESVGSLISATRNTGEIVLWPAADASVPAGWRALDGRLLSRTTYASLFALFGTTYNIGGGGENGTNFRLPDFRGRTVAGMDNMGTAQGSANVIVAGTADTLGGKLGDETVEMTTGHLAPHAHAIGGHTHAMGNHTHNMPNHVHDAGALETASDTHHHDMTNDPLLSLEVVYGGTYGLPPGYGVNTRSRATSDYTHNHDVTGYTASVNDFESVKATSNPNAGGNTGSGGSGDTELYPTVPATPLPMLQPTLFMIPIIFTGVFP